MQSVSSRVWTRVAVSNSHDDNDYTTGTSNIQRDMMMMMICIWLYMNMYMNKCCDGYHYGYD